MRVVLEKRERGDKIIYTYIYIYIYMYVYIFFLHPMNNWFSQGRPKCFGGLRQNLQMGSFCYHLINI